MKPASYSFRPQLHLYLFVSILFLVGVVFGALLVNALTLEQQQDLAVISVTSLSCWTEIVHLRIGPGCSPNPPCCTANGLG